MEAVTIAGLAVVVVGGYFSVMDFLADLGLTGRAVTSRRKTPTVSRQVLVASERGVKQMAGMDI